MVLLETGTLGTSREIYSEDVAGEARTRIELYNLMIIKVYNLIIL